MKIAIIGSGRIGSTLGRGLVRAGHEVAFAARNLDSLYPLVSELGLLASVASVEQAAAEGDAVIVATPYGAWPELARRFAASVQAKVVVDAANPFPDRDGDMARAALALGSAIATARHVPGAYVVKAFNTLYWEDLATGGGQGFAIPFAADRPAATDLARALITALAFEPVLAGGLAEGWRFDPGQSAYGTAMRADALEAALRAGARHSMEVSA